MRSSINGLIEARSIKKNMYLFRISFLTTLDIYQVYFKGCHNQIQRPRDLCSLCEATMFVRHRVL